MLVLSRKRGEEVRLSGGIVLTVVEIRGDKVRLGVTAPKAVRVWRDELVADGEELPPPPAKGTTDEIPAASMPPEYREAASKMMNAE